MTPQETEDEYMFDEVYERSDLQTFDYGFSAFHGIHQVECYSTDSHDSLVEYFEEWDLEFASFSRLVCNDEFEVWSTCVPDSEAEDEEFFELIINKNIASSIKHDEELDISEQISPVEDILSDKVKRILAGPINYELMDDEQYSFRENSLGSFQPATQPLMSESSLAAHFPLFSSVGAIMEMLDSMPSLRQKHFNSSPGSHGDLTPRSMLQAEMPVICRTHLRIAERVSGLSSRVGAVRPGAVMQRRRGQPPSYDSNFGAIRPGSKLGRSKLGSSLPCSCSITTRGLEIPMLLVIDHKTASGCCTGRDSCTLFDPGGY